MSSKSGTSRLPEILKKREADILREWLAEQEKSGSRRARMLMKEGELQQQSKEMLNLLQQAVQSGSVDINTTLDSARTQAASVAIIDITGVPTVDTLVAQHCRMTRELA